MKIARVLYGYDASRAGGRCYFVLLLDEADETIGEVVYFASIALARDVARQLLAREPEYVQPGPPIDTITTAERN